jgi:tRNA pseudouridine38-40 synthase
VRYAVGIEYVGTRYAGWQRQESLPSVQAEVERALGIIADEQVSLVCAGRTDAGVHALRQIAHFETTAARSLDSWLMGANSELPSDIALTFVQPVTDEFHARFSALTRAYRYLVLNTSRRAPLWSGRVWWRYRTLDDSAMHASLQALCGLHDFSAFRASQCQSRVPIRRLDSISVRRFGDFVCVDVVANAFLHHMVRNIVGSAVKVGEGERPIEWIGDILGGRDRRLAGPTAPADGLYFVDVTYPAEFALPVPVGSRFPL